MKRVWDIQLQIVTDKDYMSEDAEMDAINQNIEESLDTMNIQSNYIVTTLNGTIEDED